MCPGVVVQGGGAGGNGNKGGPGKGDGSDGGNGADGTDGGNGAPDPVKYPLCGTASHPVDVGTGRAFTHPIVDFELSGPLPLRFSRSASSFAADIDQGMGPSWAHSLGWQIEERRRVLRVWSDKGGYVDFPKLDVGQKAIGLWGWVLEREAWGYQLDADDGVWRMFSVKQPRSNAWLLTAIEDRNRNRIELTYADDGAPVGEGRCTESYGDSPERNFVDPGLVDPPKALHDRGDAARGRGSQNLRKDGA